MGGRKLARAGEKEKKKKKAEGRKNVHRTKAHQGFFLSSPRNKKGLIVTRSPGGPKREKGGESCLGGSPSLLKTPSCDLERLA